MCSTLFCTFLCRCFARLQREISRHFLVTRFMDRRKCRKCSCSLFVLLPLIFSLHWWPLGFLISSSPLQNFFMLFFQPKMFPLFFISRSNSLSLFFSLSFAGLSTTFSFSLSFPFSMFQICGQLIDNTDTETISAFRFLLSSLVVSALQDADGYAISRPNNLELHLGCHTC